jgi:hypothetical protein
MPMRLAWTVTDRGTGADPSLTGPNPSREPGIPARGEQGLAGRLGALTAAESVRSWQQFRDSLNQISAAGRFDTQLRSTSANGRHHTVRDLAIGIGAWPEARTIPVICHEAAAGLVGDFNQDPLTDELRDRYSDHSDNDILAAVDQSVADIEHWAEHGAIHADALLPVRSLLGTLPVLTLLHAACYQLAVYAIDIEASSTARHPMPAADAQLKFAGVAALVDVTGAIAARQGVSAAIAARTSDGVAATRSHVIDGVGAWRTVTLGAGAVVDAPSVTASTQTFIEVTTGRIGNIPALMLRRELVLDDVQGLLHITPVLEGVPGLPGGAALRAATSSVRAMTSLGTNLGGRLGRMSPWGKKD